jgi:hypothetical protein
MEFRQFRLGDFFNVGAITSGAGVLFAFGFALFAGPTMSTIAECSWIIGAFIIAAFSWFSVVSTLRREREGKEQAQASEARIHARFDELQQVLLRPDATLADVKKIVHLEASSLGMAGGSAVIK